MQWFSTKIWKIETLGRSRRSLEANIKMDKEIIWKIVVWIHLAYDTQHLSRCCECSYEISGSTKYWEFLESLNNYKLLKKDSLSWSYFVVLSQVHQITTVWQSQLLVECNPAEQSYLRSWWSLIWRRIFSAFYRTPFTDSLSTVPS